MPDTSDKSLFEFHRTINGGIETDSGIKQMCRFESLQGIAFEGIETAIDIGYFLIPEIPDFSEIDGRG